MIRSPLIHPLPGPRWGLQPKLPRWTEHAAGPGGEGWEDFRLTPVEFDQLRWKLCGAFRMFFLGEWKSNSTSQLYIYIYGPASLGTSPPPHPMVMGLYSSAQYPLPPVVWGGGGWWCTPLPPVVWVVWVVVVVVVVEEVVYVCIWMYQYPPPPCGVGGVGGGGGRSCICMYMNVYDGMNVYF